MQPGLEPVVVISESHVDKVTHSQVVHTYQGAPIPLGYLTPAKLTNIIDVTRSRPPFTTTFTNGILSTQFLINVLEEDGAIKPGELEAHLRTPQDWLRNYLAGDTIPVITGYFAAGRPARGASELDDDISWRSCSQRGTPRSLCRFSKWNG